MQMQAHKGRDSMKIYVDADACPVKEQVIGTARTFRTPVTLVKSYAHYSHAPEEDGVETVYVDTGADSADYRIMQLARSGDIIVTQDYGLASLGLAKGCIVLHHRGFAYTQDNISRLLAERHLSAKARKAGQKTKGPKPLSDDDKETFRALLLHTLQLADS